MIFLRIDYDILGEIRIDCKSICLKKFSLCVSRLNSKFVSKC